MNQKSVVYWIGIFTYECLYNTEEYEKECKDLRNRTSPGRRPFYLRPTYLLLYAFPDEIRSIRDKQNDKLNLIMDRLTSTLRLSVGAKFITFIGQEIRWTWKEMDSIFGWLELNMEGRKSVDRFPRDMYGIVKCGSSFVMHIFRKSVSKCWQFILHA